MDKSSWWSSFGDEVSFGGISLKRIIRDGKFVTCWITDEQCKEQRCHFHEKFPSRVFEDVYAKDILNEFRLQLIELENSISNRIIESAHQKVKKQEALENDMEESIQSVASLFDN